jgi:hypothetical protein
MYWYQRNDPNGYDWVIKLTEMIYDDTTLTQADVCEAYFKTTSPFIEIPHPIMPDLC